MTKEDLKTAFGSLANAARVATEHGEPITPQVINAWSDELKPRWAAFLPYPTKAAINHRYGFC